MEIIWTNLESEVKGAAELFDIPRYGRMAKKCLQEARDLEIELKGVYNSQVLFRYAALSEIEVWGYEQKSLRDGHRVYKYLSIGSMMFEFHKYDGTKFHLYYECKLNLKG